MPQGSHTSSKNLLRTGRYGLYWVSSLFSNIGTWMQQIAQPWVVLNLSNSAFWVGLDSFALNAPSFLFMLWGGVMADRYDKKKVILFFQAIQFLCVSAMVLLLVLGWLKVWIIVIISFLVGLTDSLSMPAFQSIIPSMVQREDISRAVSLNSTQFNLSRILGPMIAGIVIVRFGAIACFGANAVSYIPFFLSIYFIYPRGLKIKKEQVETKPVGQLKEFKKLFASAEVRIPLINVFVTNLFCGPLVTFSPVLIKNVFHAGANNFGEAISAFGVGGLIGAGITFFPFLKIFKRDLLATTVAILLGLFTVAIALNHSLFFLFVLLGSAGAALTVTNISANTFLQEKAVNTIRGRIASMYQLALHGGISAGGLFTGFMISRLNVSTALAINGSLAIILQIWIFRKQLYPKQ